MAITYVQDNTGNTGGASPLNINFLVLPSAGSTIIVTVHLVGAGAGTSTVSVSDNQGNSYTQAVALTPADSSIVAIFYVLNIPAPSGTFTVSVAFTRGAGANAVEADISEWSGIATSAAVDVTNTNSGNSTTASVSKATTNANDLIVVTDQYVFWAGGPGAPWTDLADTVTANGSSAYQIVGATGTYTATWAAGFFANAWTAAFAAFKAAGAAPAADTPASFTLRPPPRRAWPARRLLDLWKDESDTSFVAQPETGLPYIARPRPGMRPHYPRPAQRLRLFTAPAVQGPAASTETPSAFMARPGRGWRPSSRRRPPAVTTLAGPTTPTNFQGIPTDTTVALSWSASSSPSGIDHYEVYQGGVLIATPAGLSLLVTGLSPLTPYVFAVDAVDTLGFVSGQATITVTTLQGPPILTSLSPNTGVALETFHLVGSQFGPAATGGTVHFGTVTATINLWTDTDIRTAVPPYTTPGVYQVFVTTPGGTSASLPFTVDRPIGGYAGPFGPPTTGSYLIPRTGGAFRIKSDA